MRFSPDFLEEIKSRVPISSLIGQRVTFDRKKSNISRGDFWGCCPFHGEKTPSFHCEDKKGRYHCFGCGVSGDHFRFLTDLDGIAFPEAVERIADMAGVSLPAPDPQAQKKQAMQKDLRDVMELAAQFFQQQLASDSGAPVRAYLRNRQVDGRQIQKFRLGLAPDSRDALKTYLLSHNVTQPQMIEAGLLVAGEDIATPYDRFRNRLMFPILDLRGRVVAFGGRALSETMRAKYLNSPETELFHKGRLLYNAASAREATQKRNAQGRNTQAAQPIIVVEGYMDVIALAQAGFETAVAPLGTALTEDQIALLWRLSPDPILCFDGDQAGVAAAARAMDRALPLLKAGVTLRFAILPEGVDPDDLIRKEGARGFASVLEQARSLSDMLWWRETNGKNFQTPEEKAALERHLNQIVYTITDETLRHHYLQDIRQRLRNLFFAPQRQYSRGQYQKNGRQSGASTLKFSPSLTQSSIVRNRSGSSLLREAVILMVLTNHPQLWEERFEELAVIDFSDPDFHHYHQTMLDCLAHGALENGQDMCDALEQRKMGATLKRLQNMIEQAQISTARQEAYIDDARYVLKQALHLHQKVKILNREMQAIELALLEDADDAIYQKLLQLKQELAVTDASEALVEGFGKTKNPDFL